MKDFSTQCCSYLLGWPKFDLQFLVFTLTRKFCSFWSNNGSREGFSLGKIFSSRSTNLKIENSGFFLFSLLSPFILSHFPIISERMKLQLKVLTLNGCSTDKKNYKLFFSAIFFYLQFLVPPVNFALFDQTINFANMMIHKIGNLWNLDSYLICKILNICFFFEIEQIQKFGKFWKLKIFMIFKIGNSWNFSKLHIFGIFPIGNFFEFSKLKMLRIARGKLTNFWIFFNLLNQNLALKIGNFGIVRLFDNPHHSQFRQFSYVSFDINPFS